MERFVGPDAGETRAPMPAEPLSANARIERAEQEVIRLTGSGPGGHMNRSFRMTIPAEPDRDSDLVLMDGLAAGREALATLDAARQSAPAIEELARAMARVDRNVGGPHDPDDAEDHWPSYQPRATAILDELRHVHADPAVRDADAAAAPDRLLSDAPAVPATEGVNVNEYHMFRPKRGWVPEWLWRVVRPVVVYEPFTTLFTEQPNEEDWGR